MKLNIEKLKEWVFLNVEANNCPETPDDTVAIDIINGCNGSCYDKSNNKWVTYQEIRYKFTEYEEED